MDQSRTKYEILYSEYSVSEGMARKWIRNTLPCMTKHAIKLSNCFGGSKKVPSIFILPNIFDHFLRFGSFKNIFDKIGPILVGFE